MKKESSKKFNFAIIILFAITISLFLCATHDSYALTWARSFGLAYGEERAKTIKQTADGGFAVAAYTEGAFLFPHFWVLKLNASGYIEWQKVYNGIAHFLKSMDTTSDGGFILAGQYNSGFWYNDVVIIKLDSSGNVQWIKLYDNGDNDYPYPIQHTSDGGFIVGATSRSFREEPDPDCRCDCVSCLTDPPDLWLLKLDVEGNIEWQKTYDSGVYPGYFDGLASDYDWFYGDSVRQTSDGGYIVAGATRSTGVGEADAWLLKLDASGNIEWQKAYGGDDFDAIYAVEPTSDGGFIMAGDTYSFDASYDMWVLKLDSLGNIQWEKRFAARPTNGALSVRQISDGNFVVAGWTQIDTGLPPYSDFWILKLDASGNIIWEKAYGGDYNEYARSIDETSDGGFAVAGFAHVFPLGYSYDVLVLKLNKNGNLSSDCSYIQETNAVSVDTASVITETFAVVKDTYTVPVDITYPGWDTDAIVQELCRGDCSPPGGCIPDGAFAYIDMNCDGCVDELIEFSYSFGSFCGDDWHNNDADFNGDDAVDGMDLSIFINDFGSGCF